MSDTYEPAADNRDHLWFFLLMSVAVTIGVGIIIAIMMPSINATQQAAIEFNQKVASTYGASEVTSSKTRLFITVNGTEFSCYKPSFEDVEEPNPIQCEDGVMLEPKKEDTGQ